MSKTTPAFFKDFNKPADSKYFYFFQIALRTWNCNGGTGLLWHESARWKRIFLPVLSRSPAPAHCGSNLHFYSPTAILNDDYSLKRTLKVKHVTPDGVVREPVTKPFCLPIAPLHSYTSFPLPLERLTQLLVVLAQLEACRSGLLASLSHSLSLLSPPSLPPSLAWGAGRNHRE